MRRLVWIAGWIGVAFWSLVCALAYGFFDLLGRVFMRNADAFSSDPETVEGVWRAFSWVHSLSTGGVLVAWALVSLAILAVPWLVDRMVGPTGARAGMASRGSVPGSRPDGVIDLGPDQYRVRPDARSGPAPQVLPPRA